MSSMNLLLETQSFLYLEGSLKTETAAPSNSSGNLYQIEGTDQNTMVFRVYQWNVMGRDGSFSIATGYGLDGPRIESRWGRNIPHRSRSALRLTQLPIQFVPGLSSGGKAAGA
jgi:hypothetical protein